MSPSSKKSKNEKPMIPPKPVREAIASILWPLAIFVVAQIIAVLILAPFLPGFTEENQSASITEAFIYSVSFQLLALALVASYMKLTKRKLSWLGIGNIKLNQLKPILPAAGVYVVATIASFLVIGLLAPGANLDQEQDVGFEAASSAPEILLAFLALVIITPITEEILIRGFMFKGLNRVMNFYAAAIISAAIFALLHAQLNVGIDTFILGLALAWLVHKTGSLWPAIFLHMLKNMIAFSFLFLL